MSEFLTESPAELKAVDSPMLSEPHPSLKSAGISPVQKFIAIGGAILAALVVVVAVIGGLGWLMTRQLPKTPSPRQTAQASDPIDPFARANVLYELTQLERAVAYYDLFLKANPTNVNALSNRGLALVLLRRYELAIDSFDRAIQSDLQDAEAWYCRGVAIDRLRERYQRLVKFQNLKPGDLYFDKTDADTSYEKALQFKSPTLLKVLRDRYAGDFARFRTSDRVDRTERLSPLRRAK